MYLCEPFHIDEQMQDVQLKLTYSSPVPIRDIALRIYRKQWTIGRWDERRSEISVLIARHDDDDIYNKLDSMKKIEKQINPKVMDLF